ncbi:MAG: tRNA (adenosine(37)-N6)-dimethylallyltransferase MiaA [Oscillospiraceae bacterium]|nr:tRNA (adenosine(37)-N6)-dimethylallyltransferase MiaA [Oscillospiraceae bacterium]
MNATRIFLPVIAGPTASGKTALAVNLALRFDGEVVSADSMQIYEGLQIGTARPTYAETEGVPHHLQGFLPLSESYSVAQYAKAAHRVIAEINLRGKQPFLCGGTGLYIDAVVDNLQFGGGGADPDLRKKLRLRAEKEGPEVLLEELRSVDKATAEKLHPNNICRIIRALELASVSGISMSRQVELSRSKPSPYDACIIVLDCRNREFLYDRINSRVDSMMEAGLLDEAKKALSAPTAPTAMQAIGYKELAPFINGEITLDEAVDNLKRATRRYAKRQLSWFHRRKDSHFLYIDDYSDFQAIADAAASVLEGNVHGHLY